MGGRECANVLDDSANDYTMSQGKKTIAPADVFKALEDLEFGFLKERLEAEYNSTFTSPASYLTMIPYRIYENAADKLRDITNNIQSSTRSKLKSAPPTARK